MIPLINKSFLDDLLSRIGANLQLDKTRKELADDRYKTVTSWLKEDDFFERFDLDIFPQGSFRIGTTVKPFQGDEYDLDFVLQINGNLITINPIKVLEHLEARLKANDLYKNKITRHKRSVRVNYANEFHMDILPAFPINGNDSEFLKIPDREIRNWTDSNPKGYANWFESKYISIKQIKLFEKAAKVEPLPDLDYEELQPLQRIVQLMKRYRDIYFEKVPDYAPKSIILTTLAGYYYGNEQSESKGLLNVLNSIKNLINSNYGKPFRVDNPRNTNENFSESWNDKKLYEHFVNFIEQFHGLWKQLTAQEGAPNVSKYLYQMFGEPISKQALNEQAQFVKRLKDSNKLNMDKKSGILTTLTSASTIPHPKNTYYGD